MANKLGEAAGEREAKKFASKASRFKPPDTARVPALQLVCYELLSLLEEVFPDQRERLRALRIRIPIIASETDVAHAVAELDEEDVDDGISPSPRTRRSR